eukprot:6180807-Pleurochrysis_carterae.AAC.2
MRGAATMLRKPSWPLTLVSRKALMRLPAAADAALTRSSNGIDRCCLTFAALANFNSLKMSKRARYPSRSGVVSTGAVVICVSIDTGQKYISVDFLNALRTFRGRCVTRTYLPV